MDSVVAVWILSMTATFAIGFVFGMLAMALMVTAKESDQHAEQMDHRSGSDDGASVSRIGWQRKRR